MRTPSFYHILLIIACGISTAQAAPDRIQNHERTILVVNFTDNNMPDSKLLDAIDDSKREFDALELINLPQTRELEAVLQNVSEEDVGMVILIHPRDIEQINKLPPLYPDIYFTIIDMPQAIYAANVQNVLFQEDAGAFLLGTIASMRSNARISIMGMEEDERANMLVKRFSAGVRYSEPDTDIDIKLNLKPSSNHNTRPVTMIDNAFREGSDIIFAVDDELAEIALRNAKSEHKLVITANPPPKNADSSRLLTHMVKRYDLALTDVLRIYKHKQWRAGKVTLGLTGGYVDYALNAENVELFPKESIDKIETIKDQLAQGRL